MALTKAQVREILSAAGVLPEKMDDAVNKIVDGHVTSINALREERDSYKADAEKLPGVQQELDNLKKSSADASEAQKKYETEHQAFEAFKADVKAKETKAQKTALFKSALKAANVDEKRFDAILKVTDLDKLAVKDGKFADEKAISDGIKADWSDFIVTKREQGANVDTPPAGSGGGEQQLSRAAILAARYNANLYGVAKQE